jgi:SAM-dependent methyltransferase
MLKNWFLRFSRRAGLMHLVDRAYYRFNRWRFAARNRRFREANPGLALPPDYTLYEAYRMDHQLYIRDGRATAEGIVAALGAWVDLAQARVIDWGCGPARVVRHLPALLPGARIFGSDYNESTIAWCRAHIPGVDFRLNGLQPPLDLPDHSIDAAYALSVLTHLSEANHQAWMDELARVIRPGGVLLLTTQGAVFEEKMVATERQQFRQGQLVVREGVREGHRAYSAFQPEAYMQTLFSNQWKVLNFAPGKKQHWGPEQDTWIVQKL